MLRPYFILHYVRYSIMILNHILLTQLQNSLKTKNVNMLSAPCYHMFLNDKTCLRPTSVADTFIMLSADISPNVPKLRHILDLFVKFPVFKYCDIVRKVC